MAVLLSYGFLGLNSGGSPPPSDPVYFAIFRVSTNAVVVSNGGVLQWASNLNGPWTTLTNAASPLTLPATGGTRFFRLR